MSLADPLNGEALTAALRNQRIGHRVVVLPEATSTNDIIAQLAPESAEGLVVFAEQQTGGRGQYGRRWESAARKGLWLSVLLRPALQVADSALLTNLLAEVIAATIQERLGIAANIKPPNDVYIAGRKVAGVLVEMRVETGGRYCAITGLGINVNHSADDFPAELRATAGSLAMSAGAVDRTDFAIALLRNFDQSYAAFRKNSAPDA